MHLFIIGTCIGKVMFDLQLQFFFESENGAVVLVSAFHKNIRIGERTG